MKEKSIADQVLVLIALLAACLGVTIAGAYVVSPHLDEVSLPEHE
jgi:hypothetical protein